MTSKIIKTKFGTVITKLNNKQHKLINELAFTTTDPTVSSPSPEAIFDGSLNSRHVPEHEIKNDHLLISGVEIIKNFKTGNWEIGKITSNKGYFTSGPDQNNKINQQLVRELILHLKQILEVDINNFLEQEVELDSKKVFREIKE